MTSCGLVETPCPERVRRHRHHCMHAGLEVFSQSATEWTSTLGELGCALGWLLARISEASETVDFDKTVIKNSISNAAGGHRSLQVVERSSLCP